MTPSAVADRSPARGTEGAEPGLLVLTPLRLEARAARAGAPWADVEQTGMGPRRARRAAERTRSGPPRPVLIAGFCGALEPSLRPGDVVLASELRGPEGTTARCPDPSILAGVLRRGGLRVHVGPILSSERIVRGERRRALRDSGALAVDMESAWLASGVDARPLVALRVVVDTGARELHRPLATLTGARQAYRALRRACALAEEWAAALGAREVVLAVPRASCAGVVRAIEVVESALDAYPPPLYVRKQIVHNRRVVAELERRGAVFVEELDEVPRGATVVFSAHGVSPAVREQARARDLEVIDATCPLVAKVHAEARRFAADGMSVVLIGHKGHEEVEGTTGEAPDDIQVVASVAEVEGVVVEDPAKVAYLTQTTLAVDETAEIVAALRTRFPQILAPASDDICYATQNRQDAVRALAEQVDAVVVVGSRNSSNSTRLAEVAERAGCRSVLVDGPAEIPLELLAGAGRVGITAGASAPEALVQEVVAALGGLGATVVSELDGPREDIHFKLPPMRHHPR